MSVTAPKKHTFIFDRMKGRYVDTGPASRFDRVASFLSAGQIRVAEPKQKPVESPFAEDKFEA